MTTPESLSVILSSPKSIDLFSTLESIVVDEWHDLLSSKRGVQMSLCLSRLMRLSERPTITGISATIKDPYMALEALLPNGVSGQLTQADIDRTITLSIAESTEGLAPALGRSSRTESLETCEPASGFRTHNDSLYEHQKPSRAMVSSSNHRETRSLNRPSSWITGSRGPTRCRKATQDRRH